MKRLSIFLSVVFCMLTLSCEKEPILIISQSTVSFGEEGGSLSLPFITNKAWIASSDQSWCKVSPLNGDAADNNSVILNISCDPNTSFDSRTATVTISCMDLSQSIQVSQDKNDGLFISQDSFELTNDAQRISVEVKANIDYAYNIDENCSEWIKPVTTKGLSTNIVLFDISKNDTFDKREGKITFSQNNGLLSGVVTIRQSQQNGLFVSTPEYFLSNEKHLLSVEVKSNVDFTVTSESEWIRPVETKGLQSSQINLEVEANNSFESRIGTVLVRQKDGDLTGTITIRQDETHGIILSNNSFDLTNDAQTIDIEVTYNVDFDVIISEGCKNWIKLITTKGSNSKVYSFSIKKNETYDDRQGFLTFKQKEGPLSETVSVKQSQKDAIILAEKEYQLSGNSQTLSFDIQSNVDFRLEINGSWIRHLGTKGLDKHTLSFAIEENTVLDLREGSISLISDKIRQTIIIKQSKKQSQISPGISTEPHFSEAIELICLVFRIMGAPEYNTCQVPSVYESADSYFASMKNHEAISVARECANTGVSYDAVTAFGLHLVISEQGVISFNQDFIESSDSSFNRWSYQQKKKMLAALNDFYKESGFHEWYQSMEPYRQEALDAFDRAINIEVEWFDNFFGHVDNLSSQVILSFFIGNNNNGLSVDLANGGRLLSPVMGCLSQRGYGNSIIFSDDGSILVHEFSHPYCNPLIEKYWNSIRESATAVFNTVRGKMSNMAYGQAQTMMNETFVRASVIRYFINHTDDKQQEARIQNEERMGFLLVRSLVEALDKREKEKSKYATMEDFMPEIIEAINNYVPQFSGSGQYDEYTYPSTKNLLPGFFSVSATKKVQFTKGNLYWDGAKWKFEDNQMNFPNTWNPNHVGHLYWTKTASTAYAQDFDESLLKTASTTDHLFCDGSDDAHSLKVEGISGLRVLDNGDDGEINYLLNKRDNARKLYRFPVEIKDVGYCLVIAPDNYTGTISNSYDSESWAAAEAAGLICLTPAGFRTGNKISDNGYRGDYWTGTPKTDSNRHAHLLSFSNSVYLFPSYSIRNVGYCIRLVKDL